MAPPLPSRLLPGAKGPICSILGFEEVGMWHKDRPEPRESGTHPWCLVLPVLLFLEVYPFNPSASLLIPECLPQF